MDKALREEFRAFKVETEDRLRRLEKQASLQLGKEPIMGAAGIQTPPHSGGSATFEGVGGAGGHSGGSLGTGGNASKKP